MTLLSLMENSFHIMTISLTLIWTTDTQHYYRIRHLRSHRSLKVTLCDAEAFSDSNCHNLRIRYQLFKSESVVNDGSFQMNLL